MNNGARVVFVIPVHGMTNKLNRCLNSLSEELKENQIEPIGIVSNSGKSFDSGALSIANVSVIEIDSRNYWTGAVCRLFIEALKWDPDFVFLCNHDTVLQPGSFKPLLESVKSKKSCVSSVVCSLDNRSLVMKSSFFYSFWRGVSAVAVDSVHSCLPISVDALSGKAILLPVRQVIPDLLPVKACPHYYGDTVFTNRLKRKFGAIWVEPKSVVLSDFSDRAGHLEFVSARRIGDLRRVLFDPRSQRFLKASFFGPFFLSKHRIMGFLTGSLCISGRLFYSLMELLRLKQFLTKSL